MRDAVGDVECSALGVPGVREAREADRGAAREAEPKCEGVIEDFRVLFSGVRERNGVGIREGVLDCNGV